MRKLLAILLLLVFILPVAAYAAAPSGGHGEEAGETAAHGAEAAHGEPPIFGIPRWILKLLNMIVFWGVLLWLIGGPVKKALASRRDSIRTAASEAAVRRQKADQIASEIQARLGNIESEIKTIHERAEAEGERQKRELIAAAEAEAAKILEAARIEVENRLKHARRELTEYAGTLAAERAEALLRERITEQDQHKLFADSLKQVGEVRS